MKSPLALLTLAVALATALGQRTTSGSRPISITNVYVVDTAAVKTVSDMTVTIKDGRILNVEKNGVAPRGAEVINGRNKFLIPGLWDMHVHLSYARSSALPLFVANGITSVRDMGSDLGELDRWREQIAQDALIGPTIVRSGPMLNGMEFNSYQLAVANEVEARIAVRTLKKVSVDFIKLHRRTSREAYFAIAGEARALGLPFSGHVPMTVSPAEASEVGQSSIEHTETLFEGVFATATAGKDQAKEIARWREKEASGLFATFARNGTFVDPTLIAQEQLMTLLESGMPDPNAVYIAASAQKEAEKALSGARQEAEKILMARKPLLSELRSVTGLMNRSGVQLLAGTDVSFLAAPGFSLHDELALLVQSGLTPADALRAATLNPARLFPSLDGGSIAPGKRADLVLLNASPLDDIRNTQRVNSVILRGKVLNRQRLDQLLRDTARLAAGY
jgi:imidazolonepropionase-like amidohydrolase